MTSQALSLPRNVPWKLIGVSHDMMDEEFCNKEFPFAWRSSLAISAYEPPLEDLPEDLCEGKITYLKITCSITGYQPSKEETDRITETEEPIEVLFPEIPTEDIRANIDRITEEYFACYGALLNVAVFPYPETKKELVERNRINFADLEETEPGTSLPNPFQHSTGVEFEAPDRETNQLVDNFPDGGDGNTELDLGEKVVVTIPPTPGLAAVEATVAHRSTSGVTMEAFAGSESVGTQTTGLEPGQKHRLEIEGENIDRVVFTAPDNDASLLEFAYFVGRDVPVELVDYPHIIGMEPQRRDLYQAATETGEILTASNSGVATTKSFTDIESTETSAKFGVKIPVAEGAGAITGSTSRTSRNTDKSQWEVKTDASRERRETQGTSTQISQMYNLLTGYHKGTNRGVHLLLARPHVLQPTDYRTFVQGLRSIEGIQEFFLIVARPEEIDGLCIEAFLETGHFPEGVYVDTPPVNYHERFEDFVVTASSGDRAIEEFLSSTYTIESGWVANRLKGDPFHSGIEFLGGSDRFGDLTPDNVEEGISDFNYQLLDDFTVQVSGQLRHPSDPPGRNEAELEFRVFTRSQEPKRNDRQPHADLDRLLITSRGLCACFESGDCPRIVPPPVPEPPYVESIVDEPVVRMNSALLTREGAGQSRMPAMKDLVRQIESTMTTSWKAPRRRPFGEVGFLESDYFTEQMTELLPDEYLDTALTRGPELPDSAVKSLGEDRTIGDVLELDLSRFARLTSSSIEDATEMRHRLLGISPERDTDYKGKNDGDDIVE